MVAPAYLTYAAFVLAPALFSIYLGFTNYDMFMRRDFIGLANYQRLLQDRDFMISVVNTLKYTALTLVPQIGGGLVLAVLLNRKLRGLRFIRVSIFTPQVTSMVAVSMIWLFIYDPGIGFLNRILWAFGREGVAWLYRPETALGAIVVVSIWKSLGYNMIVYLASLQTIPAELYEAALVDGASSWTRFWRITVPLLAPTTFFLLVMATIASFNVFEQVAIMTDGGPLKSTTTVVHQVYRRAFREFSMGYASAMSTVLFLIVFVITIVQFLLFQRRTDEAELT